MKKISSVVILFLVLFLVFSCVSGPEAEESPPATPEPTPVVPTPEPTLAPTPEPTLTPEKPEEFVPSQEEYDRTFQEIDLLIDELHRAIRNKDFNAWKNFLAADYIAAKSDPEYLKRISELPALKSRNILLDSLKDYFISVIVPSRAKTTLEKIIFIDNDHVKAYGTIFNKSGILYYLEKIEGRWKITTQ